MQERNIKAEFTTWLNVLSYRVRIDFIRGELKYSDTIIQMKKTEYPSGLGSENEGFVFQSEWLENAFSGLSLTQQKMLRMIFWENNTPKEVAEKLNYTRQYVYNQCYLAYKYIRKYYEMTKSEKRE